MSLFSRFFRKAPPPVVPVEKPLERVAAAAARPTPSATDRAQLAAREEEALKAAIQQGNAETIGRLVLKGSSTKVRQEAAHAVADPAQLRQLIKEVRGGNDKSVYKILTARRDVQLAQVRQSEQLQAEIGAASGALERHSRRPFDPLFAATLEQLQSRWQAVEADAEPELQRKAQDAIDCSREVIAQHLREIAAEASRQLTAANAAAEAQRLRELAEKSAAAAAAEQARMGEAERKVLAEKREADTLFLRQIGGLIRKAQGALNEGSTGRAAGLRRAIEERLAGAPPLPPHQLGQLQQLDNKLAELKDWKSFTVGPKRQELMEEMESLIGAELDPPVLAERIKSLQDEWRTLSKGAGENLEAEWQRFHEAAQKAYQPCREYFEGQSQLRAQNLERRSALLDRLAAFEGNHNWEQADWRTVIVALRESRQEWRQHSPVDRVAGKALQHKFAALTASLQGRLDAHYSRNIEEKRALIERTQHLLESEDSRKAIDEVKALQQQWRAVGLVPREEDQRLWEEFRQHCDAVFQKRQHENSEYHAGLEVNKSQAVELCAQLEQLAELSGAELREAAAKVAELRSAFEAIGEFPRADARGLHSRFERAVERVERAAARQQADDVERSWHELFEAANRVRAYRLAVVREADEAQRDVLRKAVDEQIACVSRWPKGALEAVKFELAKAQLEKTNGGDVAANEKSLRLLCIRAEILTDVATPAEDQPLRREYQVQRLIANMGQGTNIDDTQLDAMAIEWIRAGPVDEATYLPLLERFKRCRQR